MKLRIAVSNMDVIEGRPIIWLNLEIYTKDWDPEWVALMEFDTFGFDRFVRQLCFAAPPSVNAITPTNFDGPDTSSISSPSGKWRQQTERLRM